jgi:ABC-type transport system substrate-binding protein
VPTMATNAHPLRHRPTGALLSLVLVVSLVLAACGSDDSDDEGASDGTATTTAPELEPVMGGKLVYGIDAESDGYNPVTKRFAQSGHTVASAVFDPLATFDAEGNIIPFLAESFEPNDDFTEWTINLREGVVFHSGKELTAEDVATILEAHQTSLVSSSQVENIDTVEATGPLSVLVTTKIPWREFPGILTSQVGYVFDPAMLTDPESGGHPVGTGPFVFDEWDREVSMSLVRNNDYWRTDEFGNQLPYLDEIEFQIIPDGRARNEALVNGDIDLLFTLTPSAILDLRQTTDVKFEEYNLGDEDIVALQTSVPPFDNVHARRALAYATDQQQFIDEATLGVNAPASGPYSPGQLGYRDDTGYPAYDLEKAAEELALYTEETGEETLSFVYTAADDVDNLQLAQYLKDMWAEAGIEAEIEAIKQADVIVGAVIGDFQATDWRNWGQPDPDIDYVWFHSVAVRPLEEGISLNIAHYTDDAVDAALDTGRTSGDEDERDEAYASVAADFGENVPYIWLGRIGWGMASTPQVHGWDIAIDNGTVATIGSKAWLGDLWIG